MRKKIEDVIRNWNMVRTPYSDSHMLIWALEHCQSKFYHRGNKFWFHDERDATLFALKYADNVNQPTVTFSP